MKKKIKKKLLKKNFGKIILEKIFDKKNFGKINYKRKIFMNKIYSNIDKCHTIFVLLAPFDRTGRKTGSNENVCGIWFKIGSVAGSHWMQVYSKDASSYSIQNFQYLDWYYASLLA